MLRLQEVIPARLRRISISTAVCGPRPGLVDGRLIANSGFVWSRPATELSRCPDTVACRLRFATHGIHRPAQCWRVRSWSTGSQCSVEPATSGPELQQRILGLPGLARFTSSSAGIANSPLSTPLRFLCCPLAAILVWDVMDGICICVETFSPLCSVRDLGTIVQTKDLGFDDGFGCYFRSAGSRSLFRFLYIFSFLFFRLVTPTCLIYFAAGFCSCVSLFLSLKISQ